jgi:hypothetical protein
MEGIQGTQQSTNNQAVTAAPAAQTASGDSSEFETTLKSLIKADSANQVSEEELFAAIVQERIKNEKGDDALKEFQGLLEESKAALKKPDGFVPVEDATKLALTKFRDAGKLTAEETDNLYSQAFAAAQLDDNEDALFDNRGGQNDATIAVATLEQALLASRVKIEKFDSGELEAKSRSVDEASAGKTGGSSSEIGGAGGFLFKPVSDSDKKLAILLPPKLSGLVDTVRLVGPDGSILETGRYGGNGNGGREHFRFSKPGGDYPDGLTVEVRLKTGELVKYLIKDTSQRTEDAESSTGASEAPPTSAASDPAKPKPARNGTGGGSNADLSL